MCERELIKGEIPKLGKRERHCICNQYIFHHQYEENNYDVLRKLEVAELND